MPAWQPQRLEHFATNGIDVEVAIEGSGPLVLFVHGWPELWRSWRHQVPAIAAEGYTAAAIGVRGYGHSSRPHEVAAYTTKEIAADIAGVIDQLGGRSAILVGHDWGAPIVYDTTLLYPEKVRAVAGMSVVFSSPLDIPPTKLWGEIYKDKFFYLNYFQEEGPPEAELEADVGRTLRMVYLSASGGADLSTFSGRGPEATFLTGFDDPGTPPDWMDPDEFAAYVAAYEASGFRTPINRYRAMDLDWEIMKPYAKTKIDRPALFIGGAEDPVRRYVPGVDIYAAADRRFTDFRGSHILEGIGHWVQQEAPDEVNRHLIDFIKSVG